jgi:hypothetical protein
MAMSPELGFWTGLRRRGFVNLKEHPDQAMLAIRASGRDVQPL